jgi:DNA polymerase elongation subunit (family B)
MRTISNIVVDIETIPGLDKPGPDDISVPANYKNPEVIEKYRTDPDRINELWIKQSLDFIRGRIHTIAWKINDEPTQSIWHDGTDEEGLLNRFEQALLDTFKEHYGNDTMYGVTWVGHNIKRFDAPFIWLRARKYKCEKLIKMLGESPRDVKMEDTMLWCEFQ